MAPYQPCLSNFTALIVLTYLGVLRSLPSLGIECRNKSQVQSSQTLVSKNEYDSTRKKTMLTSIKRVETCSSGQRFTLLTDHKLRYSKPILTKAHTHLELDFSRNVYVE